MNTSYNRSTSDSQSSKLLRYATGVLMVVAILGPSLPGIPVGSYNLFFFRVVTFLLYVPLLSYLVLTERIERLTLPKPGLYLLVFVAYLIASSIWATDKAAALTSLSVILLALLVAFTLVLTTERQEHVNAYLTALLGLVICSLFIACLELTADIHLGVSRIPTLPEYPPYTYRMSAWYHNSNDFSFFLSVCSSLPLVNALYSNNDTRSRTFNLLVFVAIIAVIALNQSRATILAEIGIVATCLFLYYGRRLLKPYAKQIRTVLAGLPLIVGIGFVVFVPLFGAVVSGVLSNSLWVRWQLMTIGTRIALETLFGVGVGNFPITVEYLNVPTNDVLSPHSWLTWLLGTTGLFGTGLFLVVYGRVIADLLYDYVVEESPTSLMLFASILSFSLNGLGPSNAFKLQIVWILLGLSLAALRIAGQKA